ncbi:MAG TPA: glutamine synthetase [Rhodospirillaceae bacterium]|nr:glutamine synthetase [Rhodospirillaceae bacterium]
MQKTRQKGMTELFVVDVNGVLRGKWVPTPAAQKPLRLPRSVFAVDIWGRDVLSAGLVSETGDTDGICRIVPGTHVPAPFFGQGVEQALLTMTDENGKPFFADPRAVLARVLSLYKKQGLTPVVAAALEFYLMDATRDELGTPQPPLSPVSKRRVTSAQILGAGEVGDFRVLLRGIHDACRMQGIPADTVISENGPGQFEINLCHVPDALKAADHAVLLKRAVKGVAARHGMLASFMAKPYAHQSGSGMHLHFSVLNTAGKNIFAGANAKGSAALKYAVGGLLKFMGESTAVFAPNANSYRRFRPGTHAPTNINWGYDNRFAALRIPAAPLEATRIEYRPPGADANPYLVLAAVLAAALERMAKKISPPAPLRGGAKSAVKKLPATWDAALNAFEESAFIEKYFGAKYKKLYLSCKKQEKDELEKTVTSAEHDAYLRDV